MFVTSLIASLSLSAADLPVEKEVVDCPSALDWRDARSYVAQFRDGSVAWSVYSLDDGQVCVTIEDRMRMRQATPEEIRRVFKIAGAQPEVVKPASNPPDAESL